VTPLGRLVGTWATRSGNSCDVYLVGGIDTTGLVSFAWDKFPVSAADLADYEKWILPAVVRAAMVLEHPGPALVVQL